MWIVELEPWDALKEPIAEGEAGEGTSQDGGRALMDRLDEAVGPEGWQDAYELLLAREGFYLFRCRLTVLGVTKEGIGEGGSPKEAALDAFREAAARFGLGRHGALREAPGAKPEPHELIDRLVERLRQMGKGREAARIIARHSGYGRTAEETKRLYSELRALLRE